MPGGSAQGTPQPTRRGSTDEGGDVSGNQPKKFLNGWTPEQERLMAEWADIAGCYKWLNDKAGNIFSRSNMAITIPVIILSTLTGTANFAIDSFVPGDDLSMKKYISAGIGAISIFAGILTTLGNFFQYAQKSEAHRVASIAWGKFQRQVTVELAIHPDERIEAMDFLKICRQDLDRLIEQSPPIPDPVVVAFEKEFKDIPNLKVPDICHGIEHTRVYDASKPRLGKVTAEAAMFLKYRKAALAKELVPAMDRKIEEEMNRRIEARLQEIMRASKEAAKEAGAAAAQALVPTVVAQVEAEEDARSAAAAAASPLETDWRRLLTERKRVLSAATAATGSGRNLIVESGQRAGETTAAAAEAPISVVVGDGEAPPPPSSSSSVASQAVSTEVRFA